MSDTSLSANERTIQLEYARFRMLAEAEVMGTDTPGIEFWLLGLLHLATVRPYRLDLFATLGVSWREKLRARDHVCTELSRRGIDPTRLGGILRTCLAQGARSDPALVDGHLAADDPLAAMLDDPTDTIACALCRLRLLDVLTSFVDMRKKHEAKRDESPSPEEEAAYLHALASDGSQDGWDAFNQVHDPSLLAKLALHASLDFMRSAAVARLRDQDMLNGPEAIRLLEAVLSQEETPGENWFVLGLLNKLRNEPPAQKAPDRPHDLRHSLLNPDLEALCFYGMLDPDDPDDLLLMEYLYHVRGCHTLADRIPERTRRHHSSDYFLTRDLMRREYDIDLLEHYALHGESGLLRAWSFCRLTGYAHWEYNDEYSIYSYACGEVPGYSTDQRLRLCERIRDELGPYLPNRNIHRCSYADEVLQEGAYRMYERLRYGHGFADETSYVGQLAREEAAALGIEREGWEFWVLGALRFAQMRDYDLDTCGFPFLFVIDAQEETVRCRETLEAYDIDPRRLEPLLRGVLAQGLQSDPSLFEGHFAYAASLVTWNWDSTKPVHLLQAALKRPTDALRLALMRLGLIMTLEKRLPPELRNVPKTPYVPGLLKDLVSDGTIDLSTVDFTGVTDYRELFDGCTGLRTIDLSLLGISGATSMNSLFAWCDALTEIDLSPLDSSQVTDMDSLFYRCSSLTRLDLTPLDTAQVTDMSGMFNGCRNLRQIDLSRLDTAQVKNMGAMFAGCRSLHTIDLSRFDTSHVWCMSSMFSGCESLESLDLSGFDTSHVTYLFHMFNECRVLTELDLSSFDTSQADDMNHLFSLCSGLRSLDLSNFDTGKVKRMSGMFIGCKALEEVIGFGGLDFSRVERLDHLFCDCSSLRSIDLGDAEMPRAFTSFNAFSRCDALISWRLPASWPIDSLSSLPASPREDGQWWAVEAGAWMDFDQISQRLGEGIVDTYTLEPPSQRS